MDRYSHVGLFDLAGALENLPPILPEPTAPDREALAATGTDPPAVDRAMTTPMRFPAPTVMDGDGTALEVTGLSTAQAVGIDWSCG